MSNTKNTAYWLASIIGRYAAAKGTTPAAVFTSMRQAGALDFLVAHYDVLHLDDPAYVIEDIDSFIEKGMSVR